MQKATKNCCAWIELYQISQIETQIGGRHCDLAVAIDRQRCDRELAKREAIQSISLAPGLLPASQASLRSLRKLGCLAMTPLDKSRSLRDLVLGARNLN
jgi:hypothetical protein